MMPKRIDLNDWVLAGEGGNGQVYNHKSDASLILKLNRESMEKERAEREYIVSKAVYESGIPCPQVYDLVTDGKRVGVIGQRISKKKSFARMISEDRSRLEPLAKEFAARSRDFHSVRCDTTVFLSFKQKARSLYESCEAIPEKAKQILYSCLDALTDENAPIHGDFQPGNIIRSEGRDYWIDLGDFTYGDPDFDMASLLMLSKNTPSAIVKSLFHISRKEMAQFTEIYGAEYYGSRWHTKELDRKLDRVLLLKMGLSITNKPQSAFMFLPYIMGRKFWGDFIGRACDLFVTERLYANKI